MKSIKPFIIFVLLIHFFINKTYAQTTLVEYNYVTRGLIDVIDKGYDIKSGYSYEETGIKTQDIRGGDGVTRKATVYRLKKNYSNSTVAFAIYCDDDRGTRRIMCIPTMNSSLWSNVGTDFWNVGQEWNKVLMWAMLFISSSGMN